MTQSPEQRRLVRLAASYNSKARRLGARGHVYPEQLAQLPYECHYCHIRLEVGQGTFDHVISFDRGGPNSIENIVRCCLTCNRRKFTKTPAEYAAHRKLVVSCVVCGKQYTPRWAEYANGRARTCSRQCAGRKRWTS